PPAGGGAAPAAPEAVPPLLLIAAGTGTTGADVPRSGSGDEAAAPSPSADAAPAADAAPVSASTGGDAIASRSAADAVEAVAPAPAGDAVAAVVEDPAPSAVPLSPTDSPATAEAGANPAEAPVADAPAAEAAAPSGNAAATGGEADAEPRSGRDVLVFLNRFTRWPKVPLSRAAAVTLAAALGATAGAIVAAGLGGRGDAPDPVLALQESVRMLAVEVRSLKAAVDASGGGGLAVLGERLDRSEKAQAALTEEIGRLATTLGGAPVSTETTGSVAKPSGALDGWVLWRVRNGKALVHGNGTYYEVAPGSRIPGLGVVRKIAREDGRWVVVTDTGQIVAPRG
ncbi:MAG TPA: hypothetical protein PKA74_11845, partial [Bauldia sp.]|nr:hypothetical protein [Bauldia sp.]